MTLKQAYTKGRRDAFKKFALGPPTQVDQFVASVEHGKDVPPEAGMPPMSHVPGGTLPALDGTVPLDMSTSPPTPPGLGSTVGTPPALAGDPAMQPPPSMGALGG
jgi:hypothetical protein